MIRKYYFILFFLLLGMYVSAQTSHIKGVVVDMKNSPIADVNIVLCNTTDSTRIVKATITDAKGRFVLSRVPHNDYKLFISNISYVRKQIRIDNLQDDIDDLQIVMNEKSVSLEETTVTAQRIITEFDRQIIYPGKFEKENSMDGVELIDKIRLHGVIVDMATNSIKGTRGGVVQLRLNGAPADLNDVRGIDPKLVTRVEYHDMPSMRYGEVESVVDLYVKRRESGGTAKLFTYNSVTSKNGTESASVKMNHRKSEFFLSGGHSYVHFDENYSHQTTTYNFENGNTLLRKEEGLPSQYQEDIYNGGLNYSYCVPNDVLFSTKLTYSFYGTPNNGTGNGRIFVGNLPVISKQSSLNYRDKKTKYSFYYQKNLKKKQFIAFEVMGAYIYTGSYRSYQEMQEENRITDILSDVDGDTYSVIAEGLYEKRFKKNASISAGLKQSLNSADITYQGTANYKSKMDSYITSAYAEWKAKIGKLNYSGGIRGTFNRNVQKAANRSSFNLAPAVRLGYQFSRDMQIRYSGGISVSVPSLKNLNNVEQEVDGYEARRGNPDLRTITSYSNSLLFTFYSDDFMSTLNISDVYTVHPVLGSTFREGDKFITQVQSGRNTNQMNVEASGDWSAFDRRLNIYGRIGYSYNKNVAEDYSHSLNSWYCNVGISWTYKNFTLYSSANKDVNTLSNEIINYRGQGVTAGLDYKWKNLKVGGTMYWRIGHSYSARIKSLNRFVLSEKYSYIPEGNTMVRLKLSWNIRFGRQRESNYQRIENSEGGSAVF